MKNNIFTRTLFLSFAVLVFSLGFCKPTNAQGNTAPFHIVINYRVSGTIIVDFTGRSYTIEWNKVGSTQTNTKQIRTKIIRISSFIPFGTVGNIELKITGITRFRFEASTSGSSTRIIQVKSWGGIKWKSMSGMFQHESELNSLPSTPPDLSQCTDMSRMFENATNFQGNNLYQWDVSNVKNMAFMFANARKFNGDITSWNTSKVTNMQAMFSGASVFNRDINTVGNNWDVSNVTNMSSMFNEAKAFDGNISNWNTGKVTDMSNMFSGALNFNQWITQWHTYSVTNMQGMFADATKFHQHLMTNSNQWDVSNVKNMSGMFKGAKAFNGSLKNWNTEKVTNMSFMFRDAEKFAQDLRSNINIWDVSNVENMKGMFQGAIAFNGDISNWNTSKVTNMEFMFKGAEIFNSDILLWNTSEVKSMKGMFTSASELNQNLSTRAGIHWNVSKVENMSEMFMDAVKFNGDISNWHTRSLKDVSGMFKRAVKFNRTLKSWNISKVTNMENMLDDSGLSISNFDETIIAWSQIRANSIGVEGLKYCRAESAIKEMRRRGWRFIGKLTNVCKPEIAVYKGGNNPKNEIDSGAEFKIGTFSKDKLPPPMSFTVENNGNGTLVISSEGGSALNNRLAHNLGIKNNLKENETASFTIDFKLVAKHPEYGGDMAYDIEIASNAVNQPKFGFSIKWKVTEVPAPPTNPNPPTKTKRELIVYNVVTRNGDGAHEFFMIKHIEDYPDNTVFIFNRWGNIVFEAKKYENNETNGFIGKSNTSTEYNLDTGNYYYVIDKGDGSKKLSGFLFLKKNE